MENMFISDELWRLLDDLSTREMRTEKITDVMRKDVPPAARKIGLKSVTFDIDLPMSHVQKRFVLNERFLGGQEDETGIKFERLFMTRAGGRVQITAFSDDPAAEEDFDKFAKVVFVLCGRVVVIDTLDEALLTDMLTGAQNISAFHMYAGKLRSSGELSNYAIIFLNIKNFKFINQKIGMSSGDKILISLVTRFKEKFPDEGRIYRLGADNFVIVIKQDSLPDLLQLLKSHEASLGSGLTMHVYFRAGICLADNEHTVNELMNFATAAYASAKSGHNADFVLFEPEMLEEELKGKSIMVAFPEAIKKQEFKVYYQPKIRSRDRQLVGCEALCRWIRDGEVVPPMDFIPVLERFGSISQLDLYVLEMVCRDINEWRSRGITPVRTSVNISRRDLAVSDIGERIRSITDKYGVPHELIEIELTETYTSDEFSLMTRLIKDLHSHGFKISIDDFGSGYSTLTMLKSIDADIIKLDRAFIKDVTNSSRSDKIILRNVVKMMNELDKEVIAEGVENLEQVVFLDAVGCGVIQGYYYDKPLTKEKFDIRLTDEDFYRKNSVSG